MEAINEIESKFPEYPDFECSYSGHPCSGWVIYANCAVPEIKYRIRQATHYSRVPFNIFCAPDPAPTPGEPLPANLLVPDFDSPAPRRYPCRNYVFATSRTYSEECGKIVTLFLNQAVRGKVTSALLPFVPPYN